MFHNESRTYPIQSRVFCYSKNKTFEDLKVSEIMFSSSPLPILNRSHPLGKVKGHRGGFLHKSGEPWAELPEFLSWEKFPVLSERACGVLGITDRLSFHSSVTH